MKALKFTVVGLTLLTSSVAAAVCCYTDKATRPLEEVSTAAKLDPPVFRLKIILQLKLNRVNFLAVQIFLVRHFILLVHR